MENNKIETQQTIFEFEEMNKSFYGTNEEYIKLHPFIFQLFATKKAIILCLIYSFQSRGMDFFMQNQTIANRIGLKNGDQVSTYITELFNDGIIGKSETEGNNATRYLQVDLDKVRSMLDEHMNKNKKITPEKENKIVFKYKGDIEAKDTPERFSSKHEESISNTTILPLKPSNIQMGNDKMTVLTNSNHEIETKKVIPLTKVRSVTNIHDLFIEILPLNTNEEILNDIVELVIEELDGDDYDFKNIFNAIGNAQEGLKYSRDFDNTIKLKLKNILLKLHISLYKKINLQEMGQAKISV